MPGPHHAADRDDGHIRFTFAERTHHLSPDLIGQHHVGDDERDFGVVTFKLGQSGSPISGGNNPVSGALEQQLQGVTDDWFVINQKDRFAFAPRGGSRDRRDR